MPLHITYDSIHTQLSLHWTFYLKKFNSFHVFLFHFDTLITIIIGWIRKLNQWNHFQTIFQSIKAALYGIPFLLLSSYFNFIYFLIQTFVRKLLETTETTDFYHLIFGSILILNILVWMTRYPICFWPVQKHNSEVWWRTLALFNKTVRVFNRHGGDWDLFVYALTSVSGVAFKNKENNTK